MLWKRSSLVILAGATVFVASLLNTPSSDNGAPLRDLPPIGAKRLQANTTLIQDSNFATVAFHEDGDDGNSSIAEPLGGRSSRRAWGSVTSGQDFEPANEESIIDREGENNRPQNTVWQSNPLLDQRIIEDISSDQSSNEPSNQRSDQSILVNPTMVPVLADVVSAETPNRIRPLRSAIPEGVAYKAASRIEYGKSLSRRGAAFAARQEFLYALNSIAQALDSQRGDNYHTQALNNAVVAISEAGDFFQGSSESQIGMNVGRVVESHRSDVVSAEQARTMTRNVVVQRYLAYAENQFAIAGCQNVVSSEALYSLGKLRSVMSKHSRNPDQLDVAKAIMFHRAALANNANNFRSAHELGVVLAENVQLEDAKVMIKQSLMVQQTPEAWSNLATIHERMGEYQLAEQAKRQYAVNVQNNTDSIPGVNDWVSPQQFDECVPMDVYESTAKKPETATINSKQIGEEGKSPKLIKKIKSWF